MRNSILLLAATAALARTAYADGGDPSQSDTTDSGATAPASNAVNPMAIVQGNGVKVGESTTVFPVLGVETGFVSNVFFQDTGAVASGVLRVLGEIGMGSLPQVRLGQENPAETSQASPQADVGSFQYRLDIYAAWDQYLSDNDRVLDQGGLSGGLVLRGIANPNRPLNFSFINQFQRAIRPTNFETSKNTNRDINNLTLRLNYQPLGRTLGGYVYYRQLLDLFEEDSQQFADRLDHTFGVRVNWQWLPYTRVYADVSQGVFGGVGSSSTKVSSYPLTAVLGLQTLLSVNLTLNARFGYTQGFYASGPSFANVTGGLQLGYRYSPTGRMLAMYSYEFQDSINANFFRDHLIQLVVDHLFPPFVVFARPELRFREYEGLLPQIMPSSPVRNDVIFSFTAGAHYNWRNWLATTLEYDLVTDQTDFMYTIGGVADNPSYTRHELMLGLRGAF